MNTFVNHRQALSYRSVPPGLREKKGGKKGRKRESSFIAVGKKKKNGYRFLLMGS